MMRGNSLAQETVAIVLAGGKGTRLGPLTRHVCKPALPFGGAYRNIDFSLSNCVNSNVRRIGIATQHKPDLLLRHIDEVWKNAARRRGEFIAVWPAETRAPVTGYRGTADAVYRNLEVIEREGRGLVLVLAGDHIYRMDYRRMLAFHARMGADVTVGCVDVPAGEANQFGILAVDEDCRIRQFVEKPETPAALPDGDRVLGSMGIYVFDREFLARALRHDAFARRSSHDFGKDILPALLQRARVFAYAFEDGSEGAPYWRDVGTPAAYWRAHLDLLDDRPGLRLDDSVWPLRGAGETPALTLRYAPAGAGPRGRSLVARGCVVGGVLHRSVLFDGVRTAGGSVVERSVLLPGATIGRNCRLSGVIVDSDCKVPDDAVIDVRGRSDRTLRADEPIVVTAADFAADTIHACA